MVNHLAIIGGGSTGWMAAAYLSKTLKDKAIKITLIASSDIPIIGVGESTIGYIHNFLKVLELEETEWMPKCNAVYKSAIRFQDFYRVDDPPFWYPFEHTPIINSRPISRYWLHKHLTDPAFANRFSYFDHCYFGPKLFEQGKTARSINGMPYAFHFDAGLLGEYLKGYAKNNGVVQIVDTITTVNMTESGEIASVSRENGDDIEADLYLDCTGFSALLLAKAVDEPFSSYSDYLFNNSAIAMRIPYVDKHTEMKSFTNCAAQSSGWVWNIPLYDRIGTGYVYCDGYKSADAAEQELRIHLGEERVRDVSANLIDLRVGKHERSWVKNCVALGLAAGFIEPLESTGLVISQIGIEVLSLILKRDHGYNNASVALYNQNMTCVFELIRDFLVCHYVLTSREDTDYWKDVKYSTRVPDSLKEKLAFARAVLPDGEFVQRFDQANALLQLQFNDGWPCILLGMNFLPYETESLRARGIGPFEKHVVNHLPQVEQRWAELPDKYRKTLATLPSHYEYLKTVLYKGRDE